MRTIDALHGRNLTRLRSLPRASVLVLCGALLTVVQVLLDQLDQRPWVRIVAALVIAGIAITAEVDRHMAELEKSDSKADDRSPVAQAADRLAGALRDTWTTEAKMRGVLTPAPAAVRWRWASPELAVPRRELLALTSDSPALGPLPGADAESDRAGVLLGSGVITRLYDEVYSRLPHGRLVILGRAGAGKTGALIVLLLTALQRREAAGREHRVEIPVPVLLTMAGWDPATQSLRDWVLATIDREHPYLSAATYGSHATATLLSTCRLALLLDGLDEMPPAVRSAALERLDAESTDLRVVLTSRPDEYRQALVRRRLHNAAVIEIRPVRPNVAASYLVHGQVGEQRDRWEQVGEHLRQNPHGIAAEVLSTPLMLSLALMAYQQSDPTGLVEPDRFRSAEELREHLIDRMLVAAYPQAKKRSHATQWLSWIAHHMGSEREFGWWQIPSWLPRWRLYLLTALSAALIAIVIGVVASVTVSLALWSLLSDETYNSLTASGFALGFMLELGVVGALVLWWGSLHLRVRVAQHSRPLQLTPRRPKRAELGGFMRVAVTSAVALTLLVGLVSGLGSIAWTALQRAMIDGIRAQVVDRESLADALEMVLAVGIGLGVPAGVFIALLRIWSVPTDSDERSTPQQTYRADRRSSTRLSLAGGVVVWISFAFVVGVLEDPIVGLLFGVVPALTVACVGRYVFGLAAALKRAESLLKRVRFMPLLSEAQQRQVLRQAGSVYQFRHADLQDLLARKYQLGHKVPAIAPQQPRSGRLVPRTRQGRTMVAAMSIVILAGIATALSPVVRPMLWPDHITLVGAPVGSLAFSPDGRLLACSDGAETMVWDWAEQRVVGTFRGAPVGGNSTVVGLDPVAADRAFSRDGKQLVTVEGPDEGTVGDTVVRWWDVTTGEKVRQMRLNVGLRLWVLTFNPDRSLLVTVDDYARLNLWDVETEDVRSLRVWSVRDFSRAQPTLAFSPDGSSLVTAGGADHRTRVWELSTGLMKQEIVPDATLSPDLQTLALPTDSGYTLRDTSTDTVVGRLNDLPYGPRTWSPDGKILAVASFGVPGGGFMETEGGRLTLWDADTGNLIRTFSSDNELLGSPKTAFSTDTVFSPDSAHIATVWIEDWRSDFAHLEVLGTTDDAKPQELAGGDQALHSVRFSPDGQTIATGWSDQRVRIWEVSAD